MEDQSVNGSIWNKQASTLLDQLGWDVVSDHDIDIKGSDEKKHGVDTLMTYKTPLKVRPQSVILEAKRYETKNFHAKLLQEWIDTLDKKLVTLRNSADLFELYPRLEECSVFDVGVIVIWFYDVDNYKTFRPKFLEALKTVNVSTRERKAGRSSIFVLDNTRILRLCALKKAVDKLGDSFYFRYAPAFQSGKPDEPIKTLTIEYIFSDVVLGSLKTDKEESVVFYFGDNNMRSFEMLKSALRSTFVWKKDSPLHLYLYNSEIEVRKIIPRIKDLFDEVGTVDVQFMETNNDLPADLKNIISDEQE